MAATRTTGLPDAIGWRVMAVLAAAACFGVVLTVLAVLLDEGDLRWWVALILAVAASAAAALAWGAIAWTSQRALMARSLGWLVLMVTSVFLISFAFVVWPMLLVAAPAVLRKPAAGAR